MTDFPILLETLKGTPFRQTLPLYRGYYTVARRYEFYVLVARTISHSFASLTREILFLPLEHKIHIFSPPCNILYLFLLDGFTLLNRCTTDTTAAISTTLLISSAITIRTALTFADTNMMGFNCWAITWLGWKMQNYNILLILIRLKKVASGYFQDVWS